MRDMTERDGWNRDLTSKPDLTEAARRNAQNIGLEWRLLLMGRELRGLATGEL